MNNIFNNGTIKHNEKQKGYVYKVLDMVTADDIEKHPNTSMKRGWEWLTKKELRLEFLYEYDTEQHPNDVLSEDEITILRKTNNTNIR